MAEETDQSAGHKFISISAFMSRRQRSVAGYANGSFPGEVDLVGCRNSMWASGVQKLGVGVVGVQLPDPDKSSMKRDSVARSFVFVNSVREQCSFMFVYVRL